MNIKLNKKNDPENCLDETALSELIQMALSDHISFDDIFLQFGLKEDKVKQLMRKNLKPASYKSWRKRVKTFSSRREFYK